MPLPTNMPIPITMDSQLVINNVPNYNRRGTNTQYKVVGIGVRDNVLIYTYNSTNRGSNTIVASSSLIKSNTPNGILGTKKVPVMMVAAVQCVSQGNGVFIIGPGTADTSDGFAASISFDLANSVPSGFQLVQPYPSNSVANLLLDPNNTLPSFSPNGTSGYYIEDDNFVGDTATYQTIACTGVQRDLRLHILKMNSNNQMQLLGVVYLDDLTGGTQNQKIAIPLAGITTATPIFLLPLIAYDPPTNVGSFDIGDPQNDAIVKVEEA